MDPSIRLHREASLPHHHLRPPRPKCDLDLDLGTDTVEIDRGPGSHLTHTEGSVTAEIGHTVIEIGHTGEIGGEEIDHMEGDTITGTKTLYFFWLAEIKVIFNIKQAGAEPVSYTHLTLPTILLV